MSDAFESSSCKVDRSVQRYDLDEIDDELVRRRREEEASLRDLADYVNRRILAAEVDLEDVLYGAVDGDDAIDVLYESLLDDATPTERVARVRTRLEQQGVDLESIQSDWVTHTTVRNHLRECLDVDTSRETAITLDDGQNTMEWARNRCTNIVDQTLSRLRGAGLLSTGPLETSVTIQVTCSECGSTYRPDELLAARECDCAAREP